jgi:ferredoxin, 2Fe-2S
MKLTVIDQSGVAHAIEDATRPNVMEVIREAGLDIAAQCGGSAACGTCHVYVDEAWRDRLPTPESDEEEMLEIVVERTEASRLSCQLKWAAAFDGLVVTLGPGTEF